MRPQHLQVFKYSSTCKKGVTNTEPRCTAVCAILSSATPVREGGVTNTDPHCTAVKDILSSATLWLLKS